MRTFVPGLVLSLMFSAALAVAGGSPALAEPDTLAAGTADPKVSQEPEAAETPQGKFDSLRRFGQVLDIVEHSYVKDVSQGDLIDGAIRGLLQGLDPHSTFMNPEEYKEMQETTSGEFFGIGIEISMENGQVVVVAPIEDTPAYKAGMQAGDIILTIDDQSTQELTLQDVVSRIRGPKGTEVRLAVMRQDSKKPVTMTLVRDAIPLISVKSKKLEDGYYWIRLTRFSEKTTDELLDALGEAQREAKPAGGIRGIVLDLRNNPGGLLNQAVAVSDVFLSEGSIVSIKGRNKATHAYSAKIQTSDIHCPLVVLINAGSASASEIVSGALRDQHRAVIVGERSFGKGSVQNIIPLADGSALKLTVALYYTPSGSSIQAEGIVPDIEVPFQPVTKAEKDSRLLLREKDLNRHLENRTASSKKDAKAEQEEKVAEQLALDNQLRMALQIVKGLPKMQAVRN